MKSWTRRHPATVALIAAAAVIVLLIVIINVAAGIGKNVNLGNPSPPAGPQPYLKSVHQAVAPLPPGWPTSATSPSPPARTRPPALSCGQDGPVAGAGMSPPHCR
jgi:hypothetical protein